MYCATLAAEIVLAWSVEVLKRGAGRVSLAFDGEGGHGRAHVTYGRATVATPRARATVGHPIISGRGTAVAV